MKITIKCEHLTNNRNGKRCSIGVKEDGNRPPKCPFMSNGLNPKWSVKERQSYCGSLALICKGWCERKKENSHFFKKIEPQLEKILEKIYEKI